MFNVHKYVIVYFQFLTQLSLADFQKAEFQL